MNYANSSVSVNWQTRSACRNTDTEVFFLPNGMRGTNKRRHEAAAKAICQRCPVIAHCLNLALTVQEPHGVWGGTTPEERDHMIARPIPDVA